MEWWYKYGITFDGLEMWKFVPFFRVYISKVKSKLMWHLLSAVTLYVKKFLSLSNFVISVIRGFLRQSNAILPFSLRTDMSCMLPELEKIFDMHSLMSSSVMLNSCCCCCLITFWFKDSQRITNVIIGYVTPIALIDAKSMTSILLMSIWSKFFYPYSTKNCKFSDILNS